MAFPTESVQEGPAPMLEAVDVSASYGAMTVVRGVGLTVSAGEAVGLLGPNGAGKTSFVESLAGRVNGGGSVTLAGERIDHLASFKRARRGLALVPDTRGLFRSMTVQENLALGARLAAPEARADSMARAMELFPELQDRFRQQAGSMSGGEQQMLAVAKALVADPKILILDEPTQGLAPRLFDVIIRMVDELKAAGLALLIADQNYAFVKSLADRAVVLNGGVVVRSMTGKELSLESDIMATYTGMSRRDDAYNN